MVAEDGSYGCLEEMSVRARATPEAMAVVAVNEVKLMTAPKGAKIS